MEPFSSKHIEETRSEEMKSEEAISAKEVNEVTVNELISDINAKLGSYRKQDSLIVWAMSLYLVLIGLMFRYGNILIGEEKWASLMSMPFLWMPFLFAPIGLACFKMLARPISETRMKTLRLGAYQDPRAINTLVSTLATENRKTLRHSHESLIEILPRLKASDVGCLDNMSHAKLRRILEKPVESMLHSDLIYIFGGWPDREVELRIAILKAFEQVGDESDLAVVEKLCSREAKTDRGKRIRDAALECLPFLKIRVVASNASNTLLRGSSNPDNSETLLRPVRHSRENDTETLLRPL